MSRKKRGVDLRGFAPRLRDGWQQWRGVTVVRASSASDTVTIRWRDLWSRRASRLVAATVAVSMLSLMLLGFATLVWALIANQRDNTKLAALFFVALGAVLVRLLAKVLRRDVAPLFVRCVCTCDGRTLVARTRHGEKSIAVKDIALVRPGFEGEDPSGLPGYGVVAEHRDGKKTWLVRDCDEPEIPALVVAEIERSLGLTKPS